MRIALAAAFMLVLQSMTGALATGMAAGSTELDAFGNPLCITSSDHGGAPSRDGGGQHLPDCCTLGCGMQASAAATPPDQAPIVLRRGPVTVRLDAQYRTDPVVAPDHDPGSPRAPPLSA